MSNFSQKNNNTLSVLQNDNDNSSEDTDCNTRNPLVSQFSDDEIDFRSDSLNRQSDISDATPSSSQTLEEKSVTFCSADGLTRITKTVCVRKQFTIILLLW